MAVTGERVPPPLTAVTMQSIPRLNFLLTPSSQVFLEEILGDCSSGMGL